MFLTDKTRKQIETVNKMSLFETELPLSLDILWIETVRESELRSRVRKQFHEHSFFEVHLVLSGSITYELDTDKLTLLSGQALLIPAGTVHRYLSATGDILKTAIAFSPDKTARELLGLDSFAPRCVAFPDTVPQIFTSLLQQSGEDDLFRSFFLTSRAMEMLYQIFRAYDLPIPAGRNDFRDPRFLVAKAYIENNLHRSLTCDRIAAECCLSTRQLNRIFHTETEKSLSEYIVAERIKTAKKLLREHQYTVKEIAFSLGFENEGSFISFFKRHCGQPPGIFRKEMSEK